MVLFSKLYTPQTNIINTNIASCRGELFLSDRDAIKLLSLGDQFGVRELLYKLPCSEVSVRTKTHCDIFTLSGDK